MRRYVLVLSLGLLIGVLFVGCSSSSDSESNENTAMLVALSIIDGVGFHSIDEELNETPGGAIDPAWLGKVQHAQIAVASVEWPTALREQANAFIDVAQQLSASLEADDPKAAAGPAAAGHEAQHELSTDGWAELAKRAEIEIAGHEETPAASPTGH